jgi:chloride channel protein, CIC family
MSDNEPTWSSKADDHISAARHALKWLPLSLAIGIPAGLASALLLRSLDFVTALREQNPWLLYLLPVAGAVVGWIYHRYGKDSHRGHNLLIEQIHDPRVGVPKRMAPFVFVGTIITHLFGGSAGREGTAVQMGGSIASGLARALNLEKDGLRVAIMSGIAAGFGSVFGTPVAGAIFALEVLSIGVIRYDSIFACLLASVVADWTCRAVGTHHTVYTIASGASGTLLLVKVALAGALFGLAGQFFAELTHALQNLFARLSNSAAVRPALGGMAVIALVFLCGSREFLGLGVPGIVSSFHEGGAGWFSWLWKSVFTAVTVASGFKGGEVTPLFFIGSTLGNTLARLLFAPIDLFAGLGLVAVFAGAANTPLACTLMGVELFGAEYLVPIAIACFTSYLFSGHSGIYRSQRLTVRKGGE